MDETLIYTAVPKKARIEIIPLIDVIFFLLATFVLFTLSLDKIASIEVPLPSNGGESEIDTTVYIQASEEGIFYWKEGRDTQAVLISAAEIPGRLAEYKRRISPARVFVRGDNMAKFGPAVTVLDEVRKAGISQVSVETVPSRTSNESSAISVKI